MTKHKFRSILDYDYELEQYEVNTLPSLTVPDQTMSMAEILTRFVNGEEMNVGNGLEFMDESDLMYSNGININTLDLNEREKLLKDAQSTIQQSYNSENIQTSTEVEADKNVLVEEQKS